MILYLQSEMLSMHDLIIKYCWFWCIAVDLSAIICSCHVFMLRRYPEEANSKSISVITPYKEQRKVLEERFNRSIGSAKAFNIDFNTVDGYQGREVDILIFSTVRSPGQTCEDSKAVGRGNIGFVADVRRMNVALTRARFSLWIVGNATALKQNFNWAALLSDAKTRQVYFQIKSPYVFQEGAIANTPKLTSLVPGSFLDKSVDEEGSAGMNAGHISMPRSPEIVNANANPTARVDHEPVSSKRREAMGFLKSASQPRVEKDPFLENGRSFGARSVERDLSLQSQHGPERLIEPAVDELQLQGTNSISRGERNTHLSTSVTRNDDDKDRIRRSRLDSSSGLARTKRSDEYALLGQERPQFEDDALLDLSSRRKTDVDPRSESSNMKSRVSQKMAEETRTGSRKARTSAVGKTATNQDSDAPSPRARLKVSSVDGRNEQLEKSSSMKATQSGAVEGIGCERSNEDTVARNRPSIQNHNGQSVADISPAASLLSSRQRTGSRPDSHGGAHSRDEHARSAPGRSRHSPHNTPSVNMSEWERYTRMLEEGKHTGSSSERVRDRSDRVQSSDSDRRTRHTGRPHVELGSRQGRRSDSDFRTNDVGKFDSDRPTIQAGKRDPDRNNERRSVHPPPTKKQKVRYLFGHCSHASLL